MRAFHRYVQNPHSSYFQLRLLSCFKHLCKVCFYHAVFAFLIAGVLVSLSAFLFFWYAAACEHFEIVQDAHDMLSGLPTSAFTSGMFVSTSCLWFFGSSVSTCVVCIMPSFCRTLSRMPQELSCTPVNQLLFVFLHTAWSSCYGLQFLTLENHFIRSRFSLTTTALINVVPA